MENPPQKKEERRTRARRTSSKNDGYAFRLDQGLLRGGAGEAIPQPPDPKHTPIIEDPGRAKNPSTYSTYHPSPFQSHQKTRQLIPRHHQTHHPQYPTTPIQMVGTHGIPPPSHPREARLDQSEASSPPIVLLLTSPLPPPPQHYHQAPPSPPPLILPQHPPPMPEQAARILPQQRRLIVVFGRA